MKKCNCGNNCHCKKMWLGIPIFLAIVAAATAVVMLLWNWLAPDLFGLGAINYCQALGLFALCKILFTGCHSHRFHHHCGCGEHMSDQMREEIKNLSPRQRREYIRNHMFGCGCSQEENKESADKNGEK